jgi:phosphoribosylanthranilate isomerase
MFRIKICGITNIDDAQAAADAGADAVGLNFFRKSRRFVEPGNARSIAADLPAGVAKIGIFVNHDVAEIVEISKRVGLDCVQLHGDEPPGTVAQLPKYLKVVRAHRCGINGLISLASYLEECDSRGRLPDALLIDADAGAEFGGTGQVADWTRIASERASLAGLPLILAGGLTADNVGNAIAVVQPAAVDVASGVERQPGFKDKELMVRFVTAARQAFSSI